MKSSNSTPSTPAPTGKPGSGAAAPRSDKSAGNAKPGSKRSAQQGEKKTTP